MKANYLFGLIKFRWVVCPSEEKSDPYPGEISIMDSFWARSNLGNDQEKMKN